MPNMCTHERGNWYPILSSLSSDCEGWPVCGKCDHVLLLQVDLEDLCVEEKPAIWRAELPENTSPIGYRARKVKGRIAMMGVIKLINDTGAWAELVIVTYLVLVQSSRTLFWIQSHVSCLVKPDWVLRLGFTPSVWVSPYSGLFWQGVRSCKQWHWGLV